MNFRNSALMLLAFTTFVCSSSFGQDAPPPSNKKTRVRKAGSVSDRAPSSPGMRPFASAPSRRDFRHLAERPGLTKASKPSQLLKYKAVRRELELVDFQEEELANIRKERAKMRRERLRARKDLGLQAMTLEEDGPSRVDEAAEPGEPELLPEQQERLEQIYLQLKIQSKGIFATLIESELAERLDIDEEQQSELRKTAFQLSREYEKQLAELKREFRKKLVAELNDDQQDELKSMLGEEFDINSNPEDEYE